MTRGTRRLLIEIRALVDSINTALIVREPGTALAQEAYDGLRRQVTQATSERRAHLVELVRLQEAIDHGVSADGLRRLVAGWSEQAGLRRCVDPGRRELFEVIGEPSDDLEVVNAAWVAGDPPMLVQPGTLRARASEPSRQPSNDAKVNGEQDNGASQQVGEGER